MLKRGSRSFGFPVCVGVNYSRYVMAINLEVTLQQTLESLAVSGIVSYSSCFIRHIVREIIPKAHNFLKSQVGIMNQGSEVLICNPHKTAQIQLVKNVFIRIILEDAAIFNDTIIPIRSCIVSQIFPSYLSKQHMLLHF